MTDHGLEWAATHDPDDADELDDLGQLYVSLAGPLHRIVRAAVRAPAAVVEEACQVAWSRLVSYRRCVNRETVLGWLVTTATREAVSLVRRGNRELPLESAETSAELQSLLLDPGPSELVEWRDQLATLSLLSRRQQRVLWMKGLGLTYDEIAERDGCTRRTVQRQLEHARNALRVAGGRA